MSLARRFAISLSCVTLVACGRKVDHAPPFATATVTPARTSVHAGHLVDLRYQFVVAADATPVTDDYRVFVHIVDDDGQGMWTDDHEPPIPTHRWMGGQHIEYSRPLFVPTRAWAGRFHVELGLYSPRTGERLPLAASPAKGRAYRVASFDVIPTGDIPVVAFFKGWHDAERVSGPGNQLGQEWHWSTTSSLLWCPRPDGDGRFVLRVDQPIVGADVTRMVQVAVRGTVVDSFALAPRAQEVRRVDIPSALLGTDEIVPIQLTVDRAIVPAQIAGSGSTDARALGVRVLDAFLEAR